MISQSQIFISQCIDICWFFYVRCCFGYVAAFLLQLHRHVCHDDLFFLRFLLHHLQLLLLLQYFLCLISSFISSINSLFTSEKLLTKFNGFCISWAMPAVSSPSEAIFSDWMSWDWVDFKFSKCFSTLSFVAIIFLLFARFVFAIQLNQLTEKQYHKTS